jgi:hypothetical protein
MTTKSEKRKQPDVFPSTTERGVTNGTRQVFCEWNFIQLSSLGAVFQTSMDFTCPRDAPLNVTESLWNKASSQDLPSPIWNQAEDDTWTNSDVRQLAVLSSSIFVPVLPLHILTPFSTLFGLLVPVPAQQRNPHASVHRSNCNKSANGDSISRM